MKSKRSRYVYIVARIPGKQKEGIVEIPNLGVHFSYKKAERHYTSVLLDRIPESGRASTCLTKKHETGSSRMLVLNSHYVKATGEILRLERWRIG